MDSLFLLFESLVPEEFRSAEFLQTMLLFAGTALALGLIGHLVFGKKSGLNNAVSAAIAILFIYVLSIWIYSSGLQVDLLVTPLPFVSISGDYLSVFALEGAGYTAICGEVLSLVILAFIVNLLESVLPKGKFFSWLFFRVVTVFLSTVLLGVVRTAIVTYMPVAFVSYAPVILLTILVGSFALAILKFLLGILLAVANPILAAIYTFFFASKIGKQLSKAILTTFLLTALVVLLNYIDYTSLYIAGSAIAAYIPAVAILAAIWFVVSQLL